jgi:hypothetical protein
MSEYTQEQLFKKMLCRERDRQGDWLVSRPHGPHDVAARRRFIESLPATAEYHHAIRGTIRGGSGAGHPGYYEEEVIAVYQPSDAEAANGQ